MTYKIIQKQIIALDIKRIDVEAPAIAAKALPGQYVMVTSVPQGRAMPMALVDVDARKGTISFIVHEIGLRTKSFGSMTIGQSVANIVGPLGRPAEIDRYGLVVCIATGIGAAQILPICRALKKKGNKVLGIIGAKSKKVLMLEPQMRVVCDDLFVTTNDGSYERRGLATQVLQELLNKHKVDAVYAIGSVEMMQAATVMAASKEIPVRVTLSPYMTNGLGICGSCRIQVDGKFQLACVDGPEFDGHKVDFEDLHARDQAIKESAWDSQSRPANPKSGGLTTFMKSFLGSPKNRT